MINDNRDRQQLLDHLADTVEEYPAANWSTGLLRSFVVLLDLERAGVNLTAEVEPAPPPVSLQLVRTRRERQTVR